MKNVRASEASGPVLDWLVAKASGRLGATIRDTNYPGTAIEDVGFDSVGTLVAYAGRHWYQRYAPSTDWAHGGPIIERERITVGIVDGDDVGWAAWVDTEDQRYWEYGPTPLIAAMRCYVTSTLGYEVEVPEELL